MGRKGHATSPTAEVPLAKPALGCPKESMDLSSKKAAGKSPLFFPTSEDQMREHLKELTSRSPQALGLERSRWTLGLLREQL